jgi:Predicted membrane protein
VAVAVIGAASRKPMAIGVGKPMATVLLFAVLGGMPSDRFGTMVFNALILSLAADITLLAEGQEALVVGLGLFLVAHLCYGLAFLGAGPGGWLAVPGLAVFGSCSAWLVRRQWRGIDPGLRVPVGAHALSLSLMMAGVFSTLAGQASLELAVVAAVGATLFFFSQALLPWARRRRLSVWAQPMTLALYWAGQICLVLAARWGLGGRIGP